MKLYEHHLLYDNYCMHEYWHQIHAMLWAETANLNECEQHLDTIEYIQNKLG